jgi:hypothetical protein
MFAPDATVRSAVSSLRNPRRRQRTNSDESVKLPKAKRQRSVLGEDSFGLRAFTASEQESSVDADPNTYTAGIAQKDLALRGPKRPEKRTESDGIVTLVSNSLQLGILKPVSSLDLTMLRRSLKLITILFPSCLRFPIKYVEPTQVS